MAFRKWLRGAQLTAGLLAVQAAAGVSAPSGLLFDLLRQPQLTQITDPSPGFGWIVASGDEQTAYQIQVAYSPADLNDGRLLTWDSGRVRSSQSVNVAYRGPVLASDSAYSWRVRIWSAGAEPSAYSDAQSFRTGALGGPDSTATLPLVESVIAPKKVAPTPAGGLLVDFGREAFGYLTIDLPPDWKEPLELHYGEAMAGGRVAMAAGECIRSGQATVLPPKSGAAAVARVPFQDFPRPGNSVPLPGEIGVILPFRYVELVNRNDLGLAARLRMHAVHYPFDETEASFNSSDESLNAVWRMCRDTIKATSFAGIYVDGDRERIPYEADAYINQLGHYCTDREFAMARRTQEYLLAHPTWPTEWKFHSIFMAWADYMQTGDARPLVRNYETLQHRLQLNRLNPDTGLFRSYPEQSPERGNADLVDWPDGERDGFVFTEDNTVLNAFLFRSLVLMERIARAVNRPDDARRYAKLAAGMSNGFSRHFLGVDGLYRDGVGTEHESIHANLFPLAFGIVGRKHKARVLAYLKRRGMRCSPYAAQYLLEALFDSGEAETALALVVDAQTDRSWHHMAAAGATITWEAWDKRYKPNLDWNHAWGSAPANLLPRYVLGVRPLEPGFGCVLIAPQLGSLTLAEGRVPTIRGGIEVKVDRSPNEVDVQVKRPGNMAARFEYLLAPDQLKGLAVNGRAVRPQFASGHLCIAELPAGEVRIQILLGGPTGP